LIEVEPWSINSDGKVAICRAVVPEKLLAVGRIIGREAGRAIVAGYGVSTKPVWIIEKKRKKLR
jgi:hypothetical protein